MARATVQCPLCGVFISKSNVSKHEQRHQNHPETFNEPKFRLNHEGLSCIFCGKICKSRNSLCNHERLCPSNKNKQLSNLEEYISSHNAWNKGLTKFTDIRVAMHSEKVRIANEEGRCGPGASKRGSYQGFVCDSRWELAFVIYCLDHDIPIERYSGPGYLYSYEDELHTYYPDFIINNTLIEIKGYCPDSVFNKISSVNDMPLVLLQKDTLKPVFDYIRTTYQKDPLTNIDDMYDVKFN